MNQKEDGETGAGIRLLMEHGEQKGYSGRDGNQKCMILYPNTYIYVSREKGEKRGKRMEGK